MKSHTVKIIAKRYVSSLGKTAIEFNHNGELKAVFANGDQSDNPAIFAEVLVNEVGDKFTARADSKTLNDKGKPLYLKGETVTRQKESLELKELCKPGNSADHFARAAMAFNLQINMTMGA